MGLKALKDRRKAPLVTPTDLGPKARQDIAGALNALLADVFTLYIKTKNFHWHVSGPNFFDLHRLFDEQAQQLIDITDPIAERVRKIGGTTLRSIAHIDRVNRLSDNDAEYVTAQDMVAELCEDNQRLVLSLRQLHSLCDEERDQATSSLIDSWIDEAERRVWFLFETSRTR